MKVNIMQMARREIIDVSLFIHLLLSPPRDCQVLNQAPASLQHLRREPGGLRRWFSRAWGTFQQLCQHHSFHQATTSKLHTYYQDSITWHN